MRDVARLAGVSVMTVSRAMAEDPHVAPGTRLRIAEAVAQLGYVPDRAAGGLASRRSGFIAAVLPSLLQLERDRCQRPLCLVKAVLQIEDRRLGRAPQLIQLVEQP